MPIDQKLSLITIEKLQRQLTKLTRKPAPESVHKFRTYGRRVEAILDELAPKPDRNNKKLLRLLSRLRKKAGRVRDLDVEINSLRNLKVPEYHGHKAQLMRTLAEERGQREKKLAKAFDKKSVQELRRRLKRAATDINIPESLELLALATRQLADLGMSHAPLTEKTLHQYRVAGKRARYPAELASANPDAERMVQELKRMQDEIGDWHDWLKLTQRAEELFGGVQDSALVAALRNVTRAKFRQAVAALAETRAALAGKKPAVQVESVRKLASRPDVAARVAVA
jgi:CHAD domain-containing protein